ncbi:transporter, chloramphenicol-sensitivity protein (RarD) family [Hyphomonas neptunium ATCC 15444]|uniref:Transporter, chloramphenicol-sensitivity protein (RarD) family n=2 Tax=Hyphomonas TaxID=85 RepID=Q0BWD5_HYPNA|nr:MULTISPECIES: EamA family transporter RarD [Hyphomonas]ABI76407.1 transporter, chloramphenicol-sensitivity protein (RarD) family [Hyphomonas neptunium ATCC 15444]KCZ94783.1 chloramphenicol-sensitivity protein (RarD) family protein [Hyphomonas hirschiana VP5]
MSPALRLGFPAAVISYLVWGSLPLYIRAMQHTGALELLAHRILWSVPTAIIFIAIAANWRDVRAAFSGSNLKWLALSGLLIGANWTIYIWAVNADRTMEASLGYYINPLVNVLFGMLIFSEKLRPAQWVAVGIAAIGVGVMAFAFGHIPWVALALCATFASYSVIRKKVAIDSRAGFLVEVVLLAPVALGWLVWFATTQPGGRWLGEGGWDILMLMAAGPITAVPLIFFALATKRLRFSTIGMMQYIGPTIQFLIAVLVFKEGFGMTHAIAFAFIWTALIVFTADSLMGDAKARRLARTARPA